MPTLEPSNRLIFATTCTILLFGIATFALVVVTVMKFHMRYDSIISTTTADKVKLNSILAETVRINDLMKHLEQLQHIADKSDGTRVINSHGFNETVNYIDNYLRENTIGLKIRRETFYVRKFALAGEPILTTMINNRTIKFYYGPRIPSKFDYLHVIYSTSANFSNFVRVVKIPNFGCSSNDWQNASGLVALVTVVGPCRIVDKASIAENNNVKALLFYGDGMTHNTLAPIMLRLRHTNQLPALCLSFAAGQLLANETLSNIVMVKLFIPLRDLESFPVDNICADTTAGDITQTIVIGSHSDSVAAGPGINDNGKYFILILLKRSA
jgi:hypothetical protein